MSISFGSWLICVFLFGLLSHQGSHILQSTYRTHSLTSWIAPIGLYNGEVQKSGLLLGSPLTCCVLASFSQSWLVSWPFFLSCGGKPSPYSQSFQKRQDSLCLPILMWDMSIHQPVGAARRADHSDWSDLVNDSTLWSQGASAHQRKTGEWGISPR